MSKPATTALCEALSFGIIRDERLLQDILDDVLAQDQGVWIASARQLRGQESAETQPSIGFAVTALSCEECERTADVIKPAVAKVLAKRK